MSVRCDIALSHEPYGVCRVVLLFGFLLVALVPVVQAQLISPGKLARAHQDLEGIRNCTSCHSLGNKGIDNTLCLDCHTPLKSRIGRGEGFHASVDEQNCADCHKDHFGPAFDLVRFDTTRFDHEEAGFTLAGAHQEVACRSCHTATRIVAADVRAFKGRHNTLDRTFLGLGTRCLSCHEAESPHQTQFNGEDCATCHGETQWEEAERFDHDKARFTLVGQHQEVACQDCHPEDTTPEGETFTRYQDIAFATCSTCHEDAHAGAFGANCASCHNPADWHQIRNFSEDRFNHEATGFALGGQHARLSCDACHARPARRDALIQLAFLRGTGGHTYPAIQVDDCTSCHVDEHEQVFAETTGGANCANCHSEEAWTPVSYDLERHNTEARFALTGAHLATPCTACHHAEETSTVFRFESLTCASCHASDNPHNDQFADAEGTTACAECHTPDTWAFSATFDHDQTSYPLTGKHIEADCASCHRRDEQQPAQYRGLATACMSCHAADDPHQEQFETQTCETCHNTASFQAASTDFNHNETRFPLDGAHQDVVCGECHTKETGPKGDLFIRYRPLSLACKDCHSDG